MSEEKPAVKMVDLGECPFCGGELSITSRDEANPAVGHSMPPCRRYVEEDALTFLRDARLASGRST